MVPSRTVPPLPQRRLSSVASCSSSAPVSGSPLITVTAFPARPCVWRATRTAPAAARPAGRPPAARPPAVRHTQSAAGRRQPGQIRPTPVLYTSRGGCEALDIATAVTGGPGLTQLRRAPYGGDHGA